MAERFLEQRDTIGGKGFVRRRYGYNLVYFFLLMAAAWTVTAGAMGALTEYTLATHYAMVTLVFAMLSATIYFFIRHDREIMHALEFQNALFAAAARHSCDFYAILRHDGRVVYIHPDFHRKFNCYIADGCDTLEALCKVINMEGDKRDLMMRLMRESKKGSFRFMMSLPDQRQSLNMLLQPISMFTGEEIHKDITLVLEPVSRPSGFFMLIAEKENPANAFVKNLDRLDVGYFLANKEGTVVAANAPMSAMAGASSPDRPVEGMKLTEIFRGTDGSPADFTLAQAQHTQICVPVLAQQLGEPAVKCLVLTTQIDSSVYRADIMGLIIRRRRSEKDAVFIMDNVAAAEIINAAPLAAAVVSLDGTIAYKNVAFVAMGEYVSGQSVDNLFGLIHKDEQENVRRGLERAVQTGQNVSLLQTEAAYTDEGRPRPLLLFFQPVRDDSGLSASHAAVYIVESKTGKRLDEYVTHSQKMQAVGQLAGGVAHDFNNLLTAMLGFCDLLLARHPAGDESFGYIMQIRQNANRAAGLVRQLLAFSRRQTLCPKVIDVTDHLADLSDLLARLLSENVKLTLRHARGLRKVRVDLGQLEQVIVNLAVNARDAMSGSGSLVIETSNEDVDERHPAHALFNPEAEVMPAGRYICISIQDTGCGIPKENLDKIFEPFFSTKEIGAGTGLGLATVYGIVKQTNGYAFVDTKENHGTRFLIFLPEAYEEPADLAKVIATPEPEELKDVTGKGVVLLVEDEAPVRLFSASALKSKGYDVLEAENGFKALEIMEERGKDINIIVTDVVMPGMNGPTFIEQVQKSFPDVKVIFISGYSEDQFMEHFKDKQFVEFLPKPYNLKQLAGKVKAMSG